MVLFSIECRNRKFLYFSLVLLTFFLKFSSHLENSMLKNYYFSLGWQWWWIYFFKSSYIWSSVQRWRNSILKKLWSFIYQFLKNSILWTFVSISSISFIVNTSFFRRQKLYFFLSWTRLKEYSSGTQFKNIFPSFSPSQITLLSLHPLWKAYVLFVVRWIFFSANQNFFWNLWNFWKKNLRCA